MPLRFLAYGLVAVSFIQGLTSVHPLFVIPLAFVTSLIFTKLRRDSVKNTSMATPVNPIGDGVFLFVLHLLIHFFVFALGYFIAYAGDFHVS